MGFLHIYIDLYSYNVYAYEKRDTLISEQTIYKELSESNRERSDEREREAEEIEK
jgi:hypothetical protein